MQRIAMEWLMQWLMQAFNTVDGMITWREWSSARR
jgi:hypothetical protein